MLRASIKRECLRHLTHTFGLSSYRPGQKAAAHALLSGRDVMCILPTGAGKSLCWQLPAVVHAGLTVVISPLIALMRDQVQHLTLLGIQAVSLDSLMEPQEMAQAVAQIRQGDVRIVFVSPERLEKPSFRQLCHDITPWLVVVDEAHCVVQWGESFRPAYAAIECYIRNLPKRPVLCALTATADNGMQKAISASIGMRRVKRILLPVIRSNLHYDVRTTLDKTSEIMKLALEEPCKTVIFCRLRSRSEHLATQLAGKGLSAAYYHAGLERSERISVQSAFQEGRLQILCATTAFGMGVDIPDIRRVIHDELPDTLIDYVQQTGRGGRDGKHTDCILFFDPCDLLQKRHIRVLAKRKYPWRLLRRMTYQQSYWKKVRQLLRVLIGSKCIPSAIANAFGGKQPRCRCCSACRRGQMVRQVPSFWQMSDWQMRLWFLLWQRNAIAQTRGIPPGRVLPDYAVYTAARTFAFPEDEEVPPEMNRLLVHFQKRIRHDFEPDRS